MTPAQRAAWGRLSAHHRSLLTSHRPDDFEREENLRHSITTALENVFGPRVHTPAEALLEEPDWSGNDIDRDSAEEPYAMTLVEIAEELKLSRERVRMIQEAGLNQMRAGLAQLDRDIEEAHRLSIIVGMPFREMLILVENDRTGKIWALIDQPRRQLQARTRSEHAAAKRRMRREEDRVEHAARKRKDRLRRLVELTEYEEHHVEALIEMGTTDEQFVAMKQLYPVLPFNQVVRIMGRRPAP